jgi:hypothetical protein
MGAGAADDDGGLAADGTEGADRRVDAAGEERFGTLLQGVREIKFSGHRDQSARGGFIIKKLGAMEFRDSPT